MIESRTRATVKLSHRASVHHQSVLGFKSIDHPVESGCLQEGTHHAHRGVQSFWKKDLAVEKYPVVVGRGLYSNIGSSIGNRALFLSHAHTSFLA